MAIEEPVSFRAGLTGSKIPKPSDGKPNTASQQLLKPLDRHRPAVQIALRLLAPERLEYSELLHGLHALRCTRPFRGSCHRSSPSAPSAPRVSRRGART